MLLNAAAYLLWAVFGFGLGTLIRSQIGSVVTGMVVYLVGYVGGIGVFILIRTYLIHGDWVLTVGGVAALDRVPNHDLAGQALSAVRGWWVGALVMIGWSLLAGTIGVLLTRRRDIS